MRALWQGLGWVWDWVWSGVWAHGRREAEDVYVCVCIAKEAWGVCLGRREIQDGVSVMTEGGRSGLGKGPLIELKDIPLRIRSESRSSVVNTHG